MTSPTLPSDILFEILTRIPSLETLGRSRLVLKDWNRITNELSFLELLCERTSTISGFFIQSAMIDGSQVPTFVPVHQNPKLKLKSELLDFLPVPVKIEAVSQGIVFCMNRNFSRVPQYFVCKPTTKQWEKIPNPNTRYDTITTAMVLLSSKLPLIRFKIVRFSNPKSELYDNLKCEVFDSNTWAWKQLIKDLKLPYVFLGQPVVSACGAFHWLLDDNKVFAFHYNKETWEIFYLPQLVTVKRDFPSYVELMRLVEYKHRLALLFPEKDVMELWVMEDHDKKVWSKRKTTLSIEGLNECERYEAYGLYNNDVALMKGSNKIILYKFQDSSSKVVRLENQPDQVFELLSDFNSVNLKCPLSNKLQCY